MTAATTTVLAALSSSVSYEEVLDYLENEFLPAIESSRASTAASDLFMTSATAVATTPMQHKAVGSAELQTPQSSHYNDKYSLSKTETALREMARRLIKQFEAMLKQPFGNDNAAKTISSLLKAFNKSMQSVISLTSSRQSKLFSLQTLLIFINKLIEENFDDDQALPISILLDLSETICKVFRHLEKIPFAKGVVPDHEFRMYADCFSSSLSYFCNLLLLAQASTKPDGNILAPLYNTLEDFKLVESVIFQLRPYERCQPVTARQYSVLLDFFALLATSGDPNMLSFLVDDEIAPLLNEIVRAASAFDSSQKQLTSMGQHDPMIRGYRPTRRPGLWGGSGNNSMGARVGWEEDPSHVNATRVYEFLAVLLRAVTEAFSTSWGKDERLKKRCFDKALYCLDCNKRTVRECLMYVSNATMVDTMGQSVGGQYGGGTSQGFTLQVLREAAAIFALLTELCSATGEADMFRQKYPRLYQDITLDARRIVLSTCTFLGASGVSRELFQVSRELEKENGGSLSGAGGSSSKLGFSPVIDVFLSSGRNNTRHEAIQFSHFVSNWSAAVSTTERQNQDEFPAPWAQPSTASGTGGPLTQPMELTESSLEHNSRCAMTNQFAFGLEMEAAKCLFHAASTLWATHPATSSFVQFTREEMARIRNDIAWIKVRDKIAYWRDDSHFAGQVLGEVVHVDTVNLCFYVQPVDNKENHGGPVVVPLHMLAGVEDRTKRQGTLAFTHAPETSSDLNRSRGELSIGHVILALRWCHEYAFEEDQQGLDVSPTVTMNAQILSLLLAKEITLHRENKHTQRVPPEVMGMLNAQLLDIFGEEQEFKSFLGDTADNSPVRTKGRLNDLVPRTLWDVVRIHLSEELNTAIQNFVTQAQRQSVTATHTLY